MWNNRLIPNQERSTSRLYIVTLLIFNLYVEYIRWNARLDEAKARIKTAGRNINNLRNAGDTTFMAESKEELKSLLMKVKEESEKVSLNIQKIRIMASSPITSWEIDVKQWKQCQTLFFWAPKSLQLVTVAMKSKDAYSLPCSDSSAIPSSPSPRAWRPD